MALNEILPIGDFTSMKFRIPFDHSECVELISSFVMIFDEETLLKSLQFSVNYWKALAMKFWVECDRGDE